jgi:hypothetical protein
MKRTILLLGSSIIKKWSSVHTDNPHDDIINLGIGGLFSHELMDTCSFVFHQVPRVDIIVLYCGSVDFYRDDSIRAVDIFHHLVEFMDRLLWFYGNHVHIIVFPLFTTPVVIDKKQKIHALNRMLQKHLSSRQITVAKLPPMKPSFFQNDGRHLTSTGYHVMNISLQNILSKF